MCTIKFLEIFFRKIWYLFRAQKEMDRKGEERDGIDLIKPPKELEDES